MTDDETRYAKQKRTEHSKARHQAGVQKLSASFVDRFEQELEKFQPPCVIAGLPSRWVDWTTDPELREDYEGEPPTLKEAEEMCAECPIRARQFGGNGVCFDYANATGQSHGVWGGIRREDKIWLNEKWEHTARAT